MRGRKGFTLMELMIVIAIIMILSAAIVARITTGTEKAKYAKANGEMAEIAAAIKAFYMDTGYWPYNNYGDASSNGDAGLIAIGNIASLASDSGAVVPVTDAIKAKWRGPYLEAMEWPMDPWGSYYYRVIYYTTIKTLYVQCLGANAQGNTMDAELLAGKAGGDDVLLLVHRF